MAKVMADQDGLYTLIPMNPDGIPRRPRDRLDRRLPLCSRRSRGGDRTDRRTDHAHRVDDHHRGWLDQTENAGERSVFGLVTAALRGAGHAASASPTIVSCDNIEGNGDVAREAFTAYAEQRHPISSSG